MSVSKWAYTPEMCDGDICVGDCDLCDKPKIEQIHNTATTQVQADEYEKCNSDGVKMVEKCDYIKRDAVSDYLESNNMPWRDWVKDIPSADVVEVVRCKDCQYRRNSMLTESTEPNFCMRMAVYANDNDYCSYGERAEA